MRSGESIGWYLIFNAQSNQGDDGNILTEASTKEYHAQPLPPPPSLSLSHTHTHTHTNTPTHTHTIQINTHNTAPHACTLACTHTHTLSESESVYHEPPQSEIQDYNCLKDTPHWELLLRYTLNHSTSPSGHSQRRQNTESTTTVTPNNQTKKKAKK